MGVKYSPKIVTDGLVLCLDAANTKSYPGSGTVWTDLSGNGNNGTLTNGPTFSSVNGGVIVLDGINDYIDVPINLSVINHTIIGASRYVSIDAGATVFERGGRTFTAKNNNWLMGHWGSSTTKYYAEGWVTTSDNPVNSDLNWRTYATTGDYTGDQWSFYVNGIRDTGPNTNGVNGPDGFAIGSYAGTSEFSNSHISYLIAYNRLLSPNEILQNHNALKGRFGL